MFIKAHHALKSALAARWCLAVQSTSWARRWCRSSVCVHTSRHPPCFISHPPTQGGHPFLTMNRAWGASFEARANAEAKRAKGWAELRYECVSMCVEALCVIVVLVDQCLGAHVACVCCRDCQLFSLWHPHKTKRDHLVISPTGTGKTAPPHLSALRVNGTPRHGCVHACIVPLVSIVEDMKREFDANNRVRVFGYHDDATAEQGTTIFGNVPVFSSSMR